MASGAMAESNEYAKRGEEEGGKGSAVRGWPSPQSGDQASQDQADLLMAAPTM